MGVGAMFEYQGVELEGTGELFEKDEIDGGNEAKEGDEVIPM